MLGIPEGAVVDALLRFWLLLLDLAPIDGWFIFRDFRVRGWGGCLYRQRRFNEYIALAAQLFHCRRQSIIRRLQDVRRAGKQFALWQETVAILINSLRQLIGVLANDFDRILAILLVDASGYVH